MLEETFKRRFTYIDLIGIFTAFYFFQKYGFLEWFIVLVIWLTISSILEFNINEHE